MPDLLIPDLDEAVLARLAARAAARGVSVAEAAREVLAREGDIAGTSAAWLDAASRLRREVRPSEPGADGILAALAAERDGRLERMLDREPRLDERPAA